MNDSEWLIDEAWAEDEAAEAFYRGVNKALYEAYTQERKDWYEKYPNTCPCCEGRGYSSASFDSDCGMWDVDPCEELALDECHRCGEAMDSEDATCASCGWNWSDSKGLRQSPL